MLRMMVPFYSCRIIAFCIVFILLSGVAGLSFAQINPKAFTAEQFKSFEVPFEEKRSDLADMGAKFVDVESVTGVNAIYEKINMMTVSRLMWGLGINALDDDQSVDTFLRINECEIYKNYFSKDTKWSDIRESERYYLEKNKDQFSRRLYFIVPIKLGKYDVEKEFFQIKGGAGMAGSRRLVVSVAGKEGMECFADTQEIVNTGVPLRLVITLSRPLLLTELKMKKDEAEDYIERMESRFRSENEDMRVEEITNSVLLKARDAYIVFKIKIFAHNGLVSDESSDSYGKILDVMAGLEQFEIYEDRGLKDLLYKENFLPSVDSQKVSQNLIQEFSLLRRKYEGAGILK